MALSAPRAPAPLRAAAPPPPAPRMRAAPPPAPPRPVTSAPLLSGRAPRSGAQSWRCRCPASAAPAPGTKGCPAPAAGQGHPPRPFGDSAFSVSAEPPHRELPEVTPNRPAPRRPRAVPPVSPALPAVSTHAVPLSLLSGALRGNFPLPGLGMGGGNPTVPRPGASPAAQLPHPPTSPPRGAAGPAGRCDREGRPPAAPAGDPGRARQCKASICPEAPSSRTCRWFSFIFSSKRKKRRRRRKNKRAHPPAPLVS